MSASFQCAEAAAKFIHGGNATFTLKSNRTGAHFTFKAQQKKDDTNVTFLSLLNGPDNESDFAYVGLLRNNRVIQTAKSRVTADAPSIKALAWALEQIGKGSIPDSLSILHEGRCGRCQRKLTVPASIESGFGPECVGRV
jgi:hypothetical protein